MSGPNDSLPHLRTTGVWQMLTVSLKGCDLTRKKNNVEKCDALQCALFLSCCLPCANLASSHCNCCEPNKLEEKWYGFDDELVYKYCWGALPPFPRGNTISLCSLFPFKMNLFSPSTTLIFNLVLVARIQVLPLGMIFTRPYFFRIIDMHFLICVCSLALVRSFSPSFPPFQTMSIESQRKSSWCAGKKVQYDYYSRFSRVASIWQHWV